MTNFPLEHFIDQIVELTPDVKQEFLSLFEVTKIVKKNI